VGEEEGGGEVPFILDDLGEAVDHACVGFLAGDTFALLELSGYYVRRIRGRIGPFKTNILVLTTSNGYLVVLVSHCIRICSL
jgi:hypothetical protein